MQSLPKHIKFKIRTYGRFNPDKKNETQLKHLQKYGWQCNHYQHIKNQNEIETLSEVWLAMQSLPTHLAEIKWTNSPVPLA